MPNSIPEHLIARFLTGETTPAEEHELLQWIDASPENRRTFEEFKNAWNQDLDFPQFDSIRSLRQLNARIDDAASGKVIPMSTMWLRVAAAVTIFVLAAIGAMVFRGGKQERAVEYVSFSTVRGERNQVSLPDGSSVQLNSGTTIRYPEVFGEKREVLLEGEAFFRVVKDPARPFIVKSAELSTEVLGTSFNIKAGTENTIVSVATGKVKVYNARASAELLPNQQARYSHQRNELVKLNALTQSDLAWTKNTLVFNDTPLRDAELTLENWYDVNIVFTSDAIGNCVITGSFENETLRHILEAIEYSTGVQNEYKNKEVKLIGKGCP